MRTGMRRAALAGATVAVGGLVVALLAGGGGGGDALEVVDPTPTTDDRTPLTTVDLVPSTTTTVAAGETPAPPADDDAPVLTGEGAVLTPASGTRRWSVGTGCEALARDGYEARCGTAGSGADQLLWLIEESTETGGLRASVLRPTGPEEWTVVLGAVDDGPAGPSRFRAITAVVADVSGSGPPEIVMGFRDQGTSGLLEVDVVEVPGRVVVHRAWELGEAIAGAGRLDGWAASFGPGDARCCPSAWVHEVIGVADGAWRLLSSEDEQRSAPPGGQLE